MHGGTVVVAFATLGRLTDGPPILSKPLKYIDDIINICMHMRINVTLIDVRSSVSSVLKEAHEADA